jgi:SAM-dependent methyltransferase
MSNRNVSMTGASSAPLLDSTDVVEHFTARATNYDLSSLWCSDREMILRLVEAAAPVPEDRMLDVACGTGLVSQAFRGRVASVTGLDLTPAMIALARLRADFLVVGSAESIPFRNATFDLVVCRQGIQFMEAEKAVAEMARIARPGGRIVLADLCAYGEERNEFFEILRLRNPARRNFFVPGNLTSLLQNVGCTTVFSISHISSEDVNVWSGNGAISESKREQIREIYRNASSAFRRLHSCEYLANGVIVDRMLFTVTIGIR